MESGAAEKVQRVREVVYLRETNAETYLLSNGSYECIVYAEDKYCKNDSGMLVPIDNTIVLDEGAVRNGQQLYRNTSNPGDFFQHGTADSYYDKRKPKNHI